MEGEVVEGLKRRGENVRKKEEEWVSNIVLREGLSQNSRGRIIPYLWYGVSVWMGTFLQLSRARSNTERFFGFALP